METQVPCLPEIEAELGRPEVDRQITSSLTLARHLILAVIFELCHLRVCSVARTTRMPGEPAKTFDCHNDVSFFPQLHEEVERINRQENMSFAFLCANRVSSSLCSDSIMPTGNSRQQQSASSISLGRDGSNSV
jgi:hypothetical protein